MGVAMTVTVHSLDLKIELPSELACDALILPTERAPDGTGIYHESVVTLAKELRAVDVRAEYQDDAASRKWYGERAVPLVVLELFVALGAHAAWDGIKAIIKRVPSDKKVRLRVARRPTPDDEWELLEAEGSGEEVANAVGAALSVGGTDGRKDGE